MIPYQHFGLGIRASGTPRKEMPAVLCHPVYSIMESELHG